MIIARGKKTSEMSRDELLRVVAPYRAVLLDVGTGDGKFAARAASERPEWFVIGMDPVAGAMAEVSGRALRPRTRQENLLFVVASVEQMPRELDGIAHEITVNLPWGSLMRGLILAEPEIVGNIARAAAPSATLRLVLNLRIFADPVPAEVADLPELTVDYVESTLREPYRQMGFEIVTVRELKPSELLDLETSWAKRLSHRNPPPSLLIEAERM